MVYGAWDVLRWVDVYVACYMSAYLPMQLNKYQNPRCCEMDLSRHATSSYRKTNEQSTQL